MKTATNEKLATVASTGGVGTYRLPSSLAMGWLSLMIDTGIYKPP